MILRCRSTRFLRFRQSLSISLDLGFGGNTIDESVLKLSAAGTLNLGDDTQPAVGCCLRFSPDQQRRLS